MSCDLGRSLNCLDLGASLKVPTLGRVVGWEVSKTTFFRDGFLGEVFSFWGFFGIFLFFHFFHCPLFFSVGSNWLGVTSFNYFFRGW